MRLEALIGGCMKKSERLEEKLANASEFSPEALEYLKIVYRLNPGDMLCFCGRDRGLQVVNFVDTYAFIQLDEVIPVQPVRSYTVILYCHHCRHRGWINIHPRKKRAP